MVFTFLRAQGLQTGSSLVENDKVGLAMDLEQQAEIRGVQLLLPSDVVIANRFAADAESRTVPADAIPEGWMVRVRTTDVVCGSWPGWTVPSLLHVCTRTSENRMHL